MFKSRYLLCHIKTIIIMIICNFYMKKQHTFYGTRKTTGIKQHLQNFLIIAFVHKERIQTSCILQNHEKLIFPHS